MVVKWTLPWTWACWNCSHLASSCLQGARRDWYVKVVWSCKQIQSLASWYIMACCSTISLIIFLTSSLGNLHLVTRVLILLERACIPSSRSQQRSDKTWSQWCQKWMSSLITDWIAFRTRAGVHWASDEMVWLSIRIWRAQQSSPSTLSLSVSNPFCPGLLHLDQCSGLQGNVGP